MAKRSDEGSEFVIHRVLVTLHSDTINEQALLAVASSLAVKMKAPLAALFVEDINLFHLAELPFAVEISAEGGRRNAISRDRLESQLQRRMEEARKALINQAGSHQLGWQFDRVRGKLVTEVLAATEKTDLLVLSRACFEDVYGQEPVTTILAHSNAPLLLVDRLSVPLFSVHVLFDDSPASRRALVVAAHLAVNDHRRLTVLMNRTREAAFLERLNLISTNAEIELVFLDTPGAVAGYISHMGAETVVVGYDTVKGQAELLDTLIGEVKTPVLFIH